MTRTVQFTADLITPDGSDTDDCGEECEPGHGYTCESGWWAPRFTTWQVSQDPAYADTFTYDPDDDVSPVEWLAAILSEYLGAVEGGSSPTFYASGFRENYTSGQSLRPAGHASGFTEEELNAADALLHPPTICGACDPDDLALLAPADCDHGGS